MAHSKELKISTALLDELRCFRCKHYLSFPPVQVLETGESICSDCHSPAALKLQACRNLTLEALLGKLLFPCQFQEHGCPEQLSFGQTKKHEAKCSYVSKVDCPTVIEEAAADCSWHGFLVEIADHFRRNHANLIKAAAEFVLDVTHDKKETFMFTANNVDFVMRYSYLAYTTRLTYDIRCLKSNVQDASCKIRLSNASDEAYSCTMKIGELRSGNSRFADMENGKFLLVSKHLETLGNPTDVGITVDVAVTLDTPMVRDVANDWLQTVRCQRCRGCLTPPIYCDDSGVVCSICHEKFKDSELASEADLVRLGATANLLCRWQSQGCHFAGVRGDIRDHERACSFRLCECVDCFLHFTREDAMTHIQLHGRSYFLNSCTYKLLKDKRSEKKLFTIKNNDVVFITHAYYFDYYPARDEHVLHLQVTGSHSEISSTVKFEHDYSKESKTFTVTPFKKLYIKPADLPACFKLKDDHVIVTVTI